MSSAASAARTVLDAMRQAWDVSPALVVLTEGPDHLVVYQNPASARLFGTRPLDRPIEASFPELSGRARDTLDVVLSTGRPVEQRTPVPGVLGASGEEVLLTYVFAPIGPSEQAPAGVLLTAVDITGEVLTARAAEQSALLAVLSEQMNAASDPAEALHEMTRALVPALADLAAVFVFPGRDVEWGLAMGAAPRRGGRPHAMTISPELLEAVGMPPETEPNTEPSPWDATLAQGHAVLIDVEGGQLAAASNDAGRAWLHKADSHNLVVLPLALAGQLAGVVLLLAAGARPPYRREDLPFLELVAARAGAAVSHLRAFRHQGQVALDLQHALLPQTPTGLSGLDVAARYIAGSADVEIGGDWWDVHQITPGVTGVGLGDVSGRGIQAAIVMGQARAAMRAAALAGLSPGAVLALLDRQLAEVFDVPMGGTGPVQPRFATAVYATVDTTAETLTVANAGHPPLVVRYPDGEVARVSAPPGPPIGLGLPQYDELVVPFPAGTIVLGCTDGLIETRSASLGEGLDRLERFVTTLEPSGDIEGVADQALAWMSNDGAADDDIALVVLRSHPTA
ncbi:MAG: SpoIIE family protein phosphatase [Actinomycetales bacterium]